MGAPFGHYTLLDRLAVGGMAELFLAEHAFAGPGEPPVVIKRILPHLSRDPTFVRMFVDEARLAVGLVHPNVVRTLDFGRVRDEHYLAMAYVPGVDLHRLLGPRLQRGEGLGWAASCALGLGLARGLRHVHHFVDDDGNAQNVVHRDVSPPNVMADENGHAVLMDFGIAKAALRHTRTATGAGTLKGKLGYMAPEQARGEAVTQQTDQYALGVLLYECLSGQRLFGPRGEGRLALAHAHAEAPPLRAIVPELPVVLAQLVARALRDAPEERFEDLGQLEGELVGWLAKLPGGEAAAMVELGALVRAEARADRDEPADWSWRRGMAVAPAPGTVVLPHRKSAGGNGVVGTVPDGLSTGPHGACGPRRPNRTRRPARRPGAAAARRAPAVRGGERRVVARRRRLRLPLWWALYAAACGAAGHVLWLQAPQAVALCAVASSCTP